MADEWNIQDFTDLVEIIVFVVQDEAWGVVPKID